MDMVKIVQQIDEVIDAAKNAQAEDGPDPYRRAANDELRRQRQKLIDMINRSRR